MNSNWQVSSPALRGLGSDFPTGRLRHEFKGSLV
jgi:hypothetical protein